MESSQRQHVSFSDEAGYCDCPHQEIDAEWAEDKHCYKVYQYKNVLQAIDGISANIYNYVVVPVCQGMHAYNDSRRQSSLLVDNRDHLAEMEGAKAYHEVLTIHFKCSLCGSKGCMTSEYNADTGMSSRIGKYESYESIAA